MANAITEKGVTTATNATFETMGANILNIVSGASLNLFTQLTEPGIKEGIWIKTQNQYKQVTVDNSIVYEDAVLETNALTLPYITSGSRCVIYNSDLHMLGAATTALAKNHYKWNGSSWTSVSTLPYELIAGSGGSMDGTAVVYNGEIHILGLSKNSSYYHYKWNGSSWTSVSTLPYQFYDSSIVVYNGEIHMMGAMDPGAQHYKWNGSSWTKDKDLPEVGGRSSVVVYNGEMHLIGGYNNRTNTILRQHYKFNGSSWTSVSKLPYDFWYGAAVVYEGCIHILGSYYSLNPTKHYKFNGSAWINEGDLPEYADRSACVVYRNSIYIVGSNWNTSYRTSAARITAPIKTYSPNTIIIQRGSGTTGVYFTAIADLSVISGGNRFPIGFDDIYYFDKTAFDWDAEIYYGNGTNWIKFKN